MATVKRDPSNENIINVGNDFRIESGPVLVTDTATEELLDNSQTAEHYCAPIKNETGVSFAKDALGNPIQIGKEFTYLDWGGSEREGKRVFYIFKRTPVDADNEFLSNGDRNPYFVPAEAREAVTEREGEDRSHYTYIWKEVATRATEDAAIDYCQRNASDGE